MLIVGLMLLVVTGCGAANIGNATVSKTTAIDGTRELNDSESVTVLYDNLLNKVTFDNGAVTTVEPPLMPRALC